MKAATYEERKQLDQIITDFFTKEMGWKDPAPHALHPGQSMWWMGKYQIGIFLLCYLFKNYRKLYYKLKGYGNCRSFADKLVPQYRWSDYTPDDWCIYY